MPWLVLTLSCIILWGITDILLKKSLYHSDAGGANRQDTSRRGANEDTAYIDAILR